MPVNKKARKNLIAAKLQLEKTNPEKFKLLQEKEAAARERRKKRDEKDKTALNPNREKEELLEEEHKRQKRQKLLETEKKNKRLITMWEDVRATEISTGAFLANFRIGNVLNEQSLIATLFQEVEVFTVEMMTLLWIIFYKGNAYISSGDLNTSVLDQYKDCKDYTVMFEGRSQEIGTYHFRGEVVFGNRIGEKVNFSDTYVPHLVLPGCVMKKLIAAGFVTPVLSC